MKSISYVTKKETSEFFLGPYKKLEANAGAVYIVKMDYCKVKKCWSLTSLALKDLEEEDDLFYYINIFCCGMAGRRIPWMVGRHTNTQNNNQIPKFQLWLVIHSPSCLCPSGKNQKFI